MSANTKNTPKRLKLCAPEAAESNVLRAVKDYLQYLQNQGRVVWWMRAQAGAVQVQMRGARPYWMSLGPPGTPDLVGLLADGTFFGLECKRATGENRPAQVETLCRMEAAGAVTGIVRSLEDAERLLKERDTAMVLRGECRR